jgi:uncharacterized protein (DUF885 family)
MQNPTRRLFCTLVPTFAAAPSLAAEPPRASCQPGLLDPIATNTDLQQIFADERTFTYAADPLAATEAGLNSHNHRLPDVSPAAQAQRLEADRTFLARLRSIDRQGLSHQEQISFDLFSFMVGQRVILAEHREWRMPLTSDSGFFSGVVSMGALAAPRTQSDYQAYIARLYDVPRYFEQNISNMRLGLAEGFTQPQAILSGVARIIAGSQLTRVEASPLWQPFENMPASISQAEQTALRAAGYQALTTAVRPAFAQLETFFNDDYRRAARQSLGASDQPQGRAYYEDLVRYFTTLSEPTPDTVHARGLEEVDRIRSEMDRIISEVSFKGSFAEFQTLLRTDQRFYPKTAQELLQGSAWISKRVEGRLPQYFGHLPRTPFTVRAVPDHLAPNYTGGRYNPGAIGAAGEYWVNTHALHTRPLFNMTALTLHEAVPGHHLQGAIARELADVPEFRLNFYPHAFGEGWALYAEALGVEMDVYETPYDHFGRLSYEMWRACRLVVDTGLHAMGWSREDAIGFLTRHTALSAHEISTEVDRYISWPGQALAYKWGELKIWELRQRAQQRLGARFDIKGFHDAVLANGGVTLQVLEAQIESWIARRSV